MVRESGLSKPSPISKAHNTNDFDCGQEALNEFLKRYALQNENNSSTRTYVTARGDRVVGYYSLVAGSVRPEEAPDRVRRGLPDRRPIPIILLARPTAPGAEAS